MALLMRFYDPQQDTILLDGQDLRTLKQSAIRRNSGVVLQDPLLFNDSIRANISHSRPNASLAEVEAAARAANATSSLDAESEEAVQMGIANADRIIVLKEGRIVASGRHQQLMASKGYYASLVHRQQRCLIPNDAAPEPALTPAFAL